MDAQPTATETVLSLAATDTLWLATESGVWRGDGHHWVAQDAPAALDFVALITKPADTRLIAAGLPPGLAYSLNSGAAWYPAITEQIDSSVTTIVASPAFGRDRVLLAGTEADGLLRSTDGGRSWRPANVGLTEFTILALAVAPEWDIREDAFVATDAGVYRSPNGGRAWKRSDDGLAGRIVQALFVSPANGHDQTVFAGCEEGPICVSYDHGRHWQVLDPSPLSVNCFWVCSESPELMLAGTSTGQIASSKDAGRSWSIVHTGNDAILAFAAHAEILYAGCYEGGLLHSFDKGITWQQALGR